MAVKIAKKVDAKSSSQWKVSRDRINEKFKDAVQGQKNWHRKMKANKWHERRIEFQAELIQEFEEKGVLAILDQRQEDGFLSFQSIAEVAEEALGRRLTEQERKFVFTNTVAREYFNDRPISTSQYDEDVFRFICSRVGEGVPLHRILNSPYMPHQDIFYDWLQKDPELRSRYDFAKECAADYFVGLAIEEAQKVKMGMELVLRADGTYDVKILDAINRSKTRIEMYKWYAARVCPKKWGGGILDGDDSLTRILVSGGLPEIPDTAGNAIPDGPAAHIGMSEDEYKKVKELKTLGIEDVEHKDIPKE